MSEQNRGSWGAREDNMWWPGAVATDQQQQHLMQQQQLAAAAAHQQSQIDAAASSANNTQQLFSYKMANSFQNAPTNVSSTSPVGAAGVRGYDYRPGDGMTGGNPTMNMPAPAAQWWYPPSTMDNMHNSLQSLQHSIQQQQQNMPPVHSPPPTQSDTQSRQEEAQRQHQEAQRQQAEAAIQQHHQAIAEAQARHHQLQQQAQQLQQQVQQQQQQHLHQNQLQNNHHQTHNAHTQQSVLQQHQQITNQSQQQKGRMPRAKADAKPRGRMSAYAFFVQTCSEEHKKKHPEENVVFAEFSKKCAERWKTMLDKEKKRFQEMAENDKKRYDSEMQNYTPPKGEKRGKKRKQMKDPNAPKRSLSAFFWFSNDERGKVKAQNPEYGVGDIAKELGRRWADADPELKSKFEALADKDKLRYEKEMTAYKKRNNPALQQQQAPVPENDEVEEEDEVDEDEDD